MNRLAPIVLLLPLCGCIAPEAEGFEKLRLGAWIEAKGHVVDGKAVVDEVDELQRSDSDKAEKIEVTAAATRATPTELDLLGLQLKTDAETEFEDIDKQPTSAFVPEPGEWLRVKLRHKEDEFKLRTIRKSEPRDQFKVEGEVTALDGAQNTLDVGGIRMPVAQNPSITMLGERAADDPLALFQADDQKAVPFSVQVNDNLRLGGGVEFGFDAQDEFDLNRANTRDRTRTTFQGKIDALWQFDDRASYAFFEFEAGRSDSYREGSPDTMTDESQITRAMVSLAIGDGLQLLVGRQDYDEEREWLYDEVLDGGRLILLRDRWQFEVGGAGGRNVAAEHNEFEETALFTSMARYRVDTDWTLAAYALQRTDQSVLDHEPLLFGLRSIDEVRKGLGHWGELSFARGHSRNAINNGGPLGDRVADRVEDIDGWAFDVGAIYTFDSPLRPALAIGYAYGSGRRDSDDNQGYRQTGYNDNNGKLGGVTSIKYYGELLRPELSNVAILTAAAAFRPWSGASLSVLFHTYTQDYAAQSGPFTDLRIGTGSRPNGRDPDLGYEVDVVFGFRAARQMTLELIGAHFEPGPAFDDQDAANKIDFTARFSF
jgi:hypothetical protein